MRKTEKKVVFFTGHIWESKRKAGFHHLAKAFADAGWECLFFTCGLSSILKFRYNSYRRVYLKEKNKLGRIYKEDNVYCYRPKSLIHPINARNKYLDELMVFFWDLYTNVISLQKAYDFIKGSRLIFFESSPGLVYFDKVSRVAKSAKYIYRVSDDLRNIKQSAFLIKKEAKLLPKFHLVSTPCTYITNLLNNISPSANVVTHYHGIDKEIFDQCDSNSPYTHKNNAIFVGNSQFDNYTLGVLAENFTDWYFHIIGPIRVNLHFDNIKLYGEMRFEDTIKYIKYAQIGMANMYYRYGSESLTDSLKVMQYAYVGLPYIAPDFMKSDRPHCVSYKYGNEKSIINAFEKCIKLVDKLYSDKNIRSWNELACDISNYISKLH